MMVRFHRLLAALLEDAFAFVPHEWNIKTLNTFHRLMEATFHRRQNANSPGNRLRKTLSKAAYVLEPPSVRCGLFSDVCVLVRELQAESPVLAPEQAACLALLPPEKSPAD